MTAPAAGEMKKTLSLTGLTINAMALIARARSCGRRSRRRWFNRTGAATTAS